MKCVLAYRGEKLKINSCNKIQVDFFFQKLQKLFCFKPTQSDFWVDIWPMKVTDAPAVLMVSRSLSPAPEEYDRYLNVTENAGTWGKWGFCPINSGCIGKYILKVLNVQISWLI